MRQAEEMCPGPYRMTISACKTRAYVSSTAYVRREKNANAVAGLFEAAKRPKSIVRNEPWS
jgi:hypothetical protein